MPFYQRVYPQCQLQDDDGDVFDEADVAVKSSANDGVCIPDSDSRSDSLLPADTMRYDVLPDVNSYTPMPVVPTANTSTVSTLPPVNDNKFTPLTVVTSSFTTMNASDCIMPHTTGALTDKTSTTESLIAPILPITFTSPQATFSSTSVIARSAPNAVVRQNVQVLCNEFVEHLSINIDRLTR